MTAKDRTEPADVRKGGTMAKTETENIKLRIRSIRPFHEGAYDTVCPVPVEGYENISGGYTVADADDWLKLPRDGHNPDCTCGSFVQAQPWDDPDDDTWKAAS